MTDVNQLITDHLDIWTEATEKKSSAGRGNGGGVSLYGIKKLKDLILELAVRGKLVSQTDKKGAGETLLAKILQRREALEKNKQVRPKASSSRSSDDWPFDLPDNWAWATLSQISDFRPGKTPSTKNSTYWSSGGHGYPWVSISDLVANGSVSSSEKHVTETSHRDVFKGALVPAGTLLMSFKLTIGKTSLLGIDAYHNEAIIGINPIEGVSKDYLFRFLPLLSSFASDKAAIKGSTLNAGSLSLLPVPLPPLAEQNRIVAKVDELMGLCDALERQAEDSLKAHQTLVETCLATLTNSRSPEDLTQNWTRIEAHFDALFTTEDSVEALRRAVLDLALRGSLTDQREDAAPASVLLSELYAKNKKLASSRHRTIVSKIKEVEPPFDLPESWAWSNLGLLSSDLRYGTSKKCDRDDKLVPVLRIPNVSGGRVDLDDMKFGPLDPKEVADLRLRANDLLIIRSNGSLDIVGSFAVVPELEGDFAFAGYLVRVRIDPAFVDPRYIWYVSRSRFLRDQIEGPIRHGVGLKNVNSTELASLQFPIPPREEQERIVDKLDGLFELCDRLAQRVDDSNTINLALADTLASKIH
ncbi:restriction endonuclease subunit S [Salipiger manganoxidans]|uniref:restriction endonuclease subunit S n=1 Tax=Salipiger marinus TaxID=555512 RepID=UPI001E4C2321|nr:restriction endonuclease subunit S [Salipiger manganoxidans]MCD1617490.1 restriction endonuclease subunit S [Salipiger manganoxidans]